MKTIYYDITELYKYDKKTGIQRVTRAIMNELYSKIQFQEYKIVLIYADGEKGKFYLINSDSELSYMSLSNQYITPEKNDIYICVDLTYNIKQNLINELLSFKKSGVKIFYTIYDLIPIRHPEWFEGTNYWFEGNDYLDLFNFWFKNIIQITDGLLCISKTVKEDMLCWLEENRNIILKVPKVEYFYLGANIEASLPNKTPIKNSIIDLIKNKLTFLVVGTIEPRKGHKIILDTFNTLWAKNIDLNVVFVGKQGWKVDELINNILENKQYEKKLFWLNNVSDEYLENLYENSTALLFLSTQEGFGLPLIEAANKKLPIIANDIPIFREVCENNAYYIDIDKDNVEEKMLTWIALYNKNLHPLSTNFKTLSWNESAIQLIKSIEMILGYNLK